VGWLRPPLPEGPWGVLGVYFGKVLGALRARGGPQNNPNCIFIGSAADFIERPWGHCRTNPETRAQIA